MSNVDEKAVSKVTDGIKEMSKIIKKGLTVDKQSGVFSSDTSTYEKTLPMSGLDIDTVKKVANHNNDFVAASTMAVGDLAVEAMAGNKKLERCVCDIKTIERDKVSIIIDRQRDYRNPGDGSTITRYGDTKVIMDTKADRNSGVLKEIKASLNDEAAKRFK